MTLPSVIANYQKKQTVVKLKKVYTTLSQAVDMSKADYGDVSTWGLEEGYGTESGAVARDFVSNFANKFVVPYLAKAQNLGYISLQSFGYKKLPSNLDGTEPLWLSSTSRSNMFILSDGTPIGIKYDDINKGTEEEPKRVAWAIFFWTDLNGINGPNVVGRDIFLFKLKLAENARLAPYYYENSSFASNLRNCKIGGIESRVCTGVIVADGWQMKSYYPWR